MGDVGEFFEDTADFFTEDIGRMQPMDWLGPKGPLGEAFFGGGRGGPGGLQTTGQTSTTNMYDPVASRKLADIAERQQEMGEEQWAMYQKYMFPLELEAIQANREILPLIKEASKTTLGIQPEVTKEFYRQATEGVDVGRRMDEAAAEVRSASGIGQEMRRREMSRYGINPSSSAFANMANLANIETAKGIAGARTVAKNLAEQEKFSRIGFSLGRGIFQTSVGPQTDPYARAAGSYAGAAGTQGSLANRVLGATTTTKQAQPLGGTGQMIGGLGGAIIGGMVGGPTGAQVGYGIGSGIGSGFY